MNNNYSPDKKPQAKKTVWQHITKINKVLVGSNAMMFILLGVFLLIFLYDRVPNYISRQPSNQQTAETACRGTANNYTSPFDGKTYTYTCGNDGIWAYTDSFNDPSCNLVKGNIAFESKEKIYHVKGQTYYDDTSIDREYGERWFCSEQEAINAGWRKSYE